MAGRVVVGDGPGMTQPTKEAPIGLAPHPAVFNDKVLVAIRDMLKYLSVKTILDPFAGIGRIHELRPMYETYGVEIEPEWADYYPQWTTAGDSVELEDVLAAAGFPERYDAVVTSPVYGNRMCLAPEHRILTDDLRWVPAGDLGEGEGLLAFDESTGDSGLKSNGHAFRRKWRNGHVVQSYGAKKECVRVWLETGESIVCTADHPWLVNRARSTAQWVEAQHLLEIPNRWGGYHPTHNPVYALRQLEPWIQETGYEAGWLAGMFDGEGSLSYGPHGSPKLMLCQAKGPIADQVTHRLDRLGIEWSSIDRTREGDRQPIVNIYVGGGFPGILTAMGRLRPERLIRKLAELGVHSRSIQPWRVKVEAVEPVGVRDIQVIESSTRTYFGEGYLMHNSDHHEAKDGSKRNTYRHKLGRALHPNNAGQMQWGREYRNLHAKVWKACTNVIHAGWAADTKPDGYFILNIKDHIRSGERIEVAKWHVNMLHSLGWKLAENQKVKTRGNRYGANADLRVDFEYVLLFERQH